MRHKRTTKLTRTTPTHRAAPLRAIVHPRKPVTRKTGHYKPERAVKSVSKAHTDTAPKTSWWLVPREQFAEIRAQEQPRMQESTFGRILPSKFAPNLYENVSKRKDDEQ